MKFLGCLLMMLVAQTISDQRILSLPDGQTGPAPCARTCSGVASYKDTGDNRWWDWPLNRGKAYKITDIAECGFVTVPVATAATRGPYYSRYCPSIRVRGVYSTRLFFITFEDATPSDMVREKCDVHWIATGYIC